MAMSDVNKARKDAVREAWKNERSLVREGKGTRDWSQRQQIGMIRKGQVSGYDGHHMQSVKTHPQQAGNPQNIQFLNKSEHIKGAHRGSTQNATNGYYNPQTGTMHSFGSRNPQAPQMQLSAPLSQNQINSAIKREQAYQSRMARDTATANQWRQAHGYAPMGQRSNSQGNKGIEAARQKAAQKQSGTSASQSGQSTNQGIKSYQSKTTGQAPSSLKSNSAIKGASTGNGKSGGSSSGGQSSGGQSR
jgi:hypothetical protein